MKLWITPTPEYDAYRSLANWRRVDPRPTVLACSSPSCCGGPATSKPVTLNMRRWGRELLTTRLEELGLLDARRSAEAREAAEDRKLAREEKRRRERGAAVKARKRRRG